MKEQAAELGGRLETAQEHEAYLKDLLFKQFDGPVTEAEEAALKMLVENWMIHQKDDFDGAEVIRI